MTDIAELESERATEQPDLGTQPDRAHAYEWRLSALRARLAVEDHRAAMASGDVRVLVERMKTDEEHARYLVQLHWTRASVLIGAALSLIAIIVSVIALLKSPA